MVASLRQIGFLFIVIFLTTPSRCSAVADILLSGGTIIDGAGGEPYQGNVIIVGDKISAVGDVVVVVGAAKKTIDCKGLIIAPGFIDLHNHSDESILADKTRSARCYLTQGCTTLVTGNCGGGREDIGKYYDEIAEKGSGINIAQLIPHGAVRDEVMGKVRRAPTAEELDKIKALTTAGMKQGAWGMSTGLQYVPGSYAKTDELIAMARVVGQHGGIYASHIRDESDELIESIEEVIAIARGADLPCHVSHFKSSKQRNWGKIRVAARLIEEARKNGLTITADQYPYTASSTSIMAMLLPDEEREGGEAETSKRLKDPKVVESLRPIIAEALESRGKIMIAKFANNSQWVGKMISDIAAAEKREPVEIGLELLSDPKAQGVNFGMDEADVRYAMTLPWVATASDGSSKIVDGSNPHPRSFGTFPRKIGRYSIQEKVLPLPAAIRGATGLPADIIGFTDRGYIRPDMAADICVFDPKRFMDHATYEKPFEESTGVRWLLVNGEIAIADGVPQEVFAGRPLRKQAKTTDAGNSSTGAARDQWSKTGRGTQGVPPKCPHESMATMTVRDGLRVELVAAEPMVQSPVAIDFGPDGKVWVAEMRDYGCKDGETCPPIGRVSVLEDRDSNGTFETATVFLDKIAQPMGVTVWRDGVLISAAPDLLYAKDTDGDRKADKVEKLFTGFSVENGQARLNMLAYGLDGWLQAGSLFVGKISGTKGEEIDIGNRDFRLQPDIPAIELENGQTQHVRVRDDWGNWFGSENGRLCLHYPIPDRYLRRSKHLVPPQLVVNVPSAAAARLYPRGKLVLFELSGPPGRATAACGLAIYRDELLGREFRDNAFTCEPVNQLVHRMMLRPQGATFVGERAEDEKESEFLASTDNWFRPVQARTGPDGALWIVDMYRYVIEHSRWIPQKVLDELDLRAGNSLGRIYRVLPRDAKAQSLPRIDKLDTANLVAAMDSPNGTLRDIVQQQLVWRNDRAAVPLLDRLVSDSARPATRLQALCTLDAMGQLADKSIERALADPHPGVRRQAVRIAESRLKKSPRLLAAMLKLANDSDAFVAQQVAFSLGETDDPRKLAALARLAQANADDVYVTTAVLTSVSEDELGELLKRLLVASQKIPASLVCRCMELAGTTSSSTTLATAVEIASALTHDGDMSKFAAFESFLDGLRRNPSGIEPLSSSDVARLKKICRECIEIATNDRLEVDMRVAAIEVLGSAPESLVSSAAVLGRFLTPDHDLKLQRAAIDALACGTQDEVAAQLLDAWPTFTPSLRTRVLEVLLSRKEWVRALLHAVSSNSFSAADIDATHRARLAEYPDEEIRQKAASSLVGVSLSSRAEIVDRYAKSLPVGDAVRGQAVFTKNCAACHEFHGVGSKVGPDIAAIKDKTNDGLLREILDPNRAVDQRYAEYVAITADGRVKNGILVEETSNAIMLRGQQGEQISLLRSELETLTSSGKSLMPEGVENQITPQDMADLLKFLASP